MSLMPPVPPPALAETIARLNGVAGQLEQHSGEIAATIERQLATFLGHAADQLGERQAQLAPVIQSFGGVLLQIGGILSTLGTEEEGIFASAAAAAAASAAALQPEGEQAAERAATEAYAVVVAQAAAALNALVDTELAALQTRLRTAGLDGAGLGAAAGVAAGAATVLFAGGGSGYFKNPINTSTVSTPQTLPPGVNNPIGKQWIDEIERLHPNWPSQKIRVEWDRDTQLKLQRAKAKGATWNFNPVNVTDVAGNPDIVLVGLSPDSTNATVYEEYLHVKEAMARGWAGLPDTNTEAGAIAQCKEEIRVEYQVLENAQNLQMSSQQFDDILQGRQTNYIDRLRSIYSRHPNWKWPPTDPEVAPYLTDPVKPGGLP